MQVLDQHDVGRSPSSARNSTHAFVERLARGQRMQVGRGVEAEREPRISRPPACATSSGAIGLEEAELLPQHLGQRAYVVPRPYGKQRPVRRSGSGICLRALPELAHQARLADAGVAEHVTSCGVAPRPRAVRGAAGRARRTADECAPWPPTRGGRISESARTSVRHASARSPAVAVRRTRTRRRAAARSAPDEDLARRPQFLEARAALTGAAASRRHAADHDFAGFDPDAQLESSPTSARRRCIASATWNARSA